MNKIISKEQFSQKVFKFEVEAPLIARSRKAGHFVIVRVDAKGERMPLTIAGANLQKGTITLVVQEVGLSSTKLCQLNEGDYILDVVGPLGQATHIENFGTVVCAGGGVGVAPMLPIIQALKAAGNRVISVLAGRSKDLIILENEVRKSSDEVIIMTDDGSYGNKGLVTEGIESVIKREKVDKCFAIGPAIMMKFCCLLTQKYDIPTDVSLNTIMVDGTGMCGACRITVGGKQSLSAWMVPSLTVIRWNGTRCSSVWARSRMWNVKKWPTWPPPYATLCPKIMQEKKHLLKKKTPRRPKPPWKNCLTAKPRGAKLFARA